MSKELEALEIIKKASYFVDFELDAKVSEDYKKEIKIIEKALKRNITLELANIELEHHLRLANKELKALEIIKEKRVNVGYLIHDIKEHYMTYETYLENYDYYQDILIPLTKEEYDLLKEVLL